MGGGYATGNIFGECTPHLGPPPREGRRKKDEKYINMFAALKHHVLFLTALIALAVLPAQAMAYTVLNCDGAGGVERGTELFYSDAADEGSFCGQVAVTRIFSTVICNFVVILNDVLGKMYCGIQYTLQDYVAILITLYVMVFGIQILTGHTRLTAKEMMVRFFKIGLVWAFVSNSNWGVDLVFRFFIDAANTGIWWVLSAIPGVARDMQLPSFSGGVSGTMPVYVYIDSFIYEAISGPFTQANAKVIGFFAALGFMSLPIFTIAVIWLIMSFKIVVRTLVTFMLGMTAIAFLISLSPIFMCFMLFQPTFNFFENWLKFMISYSLQIVIVFACVVMWLLAMTNFIGFFNQLSDVIFPMNTISRAANAVSASKSFGICPYLITVNSDPSTPPLGPNVKCADPDFDVNPATNPGGAFEAYVDQFNLIALSNVAPAQNKVDEDGNPIGPQDLDPDSEQHRLARLLYFVTYHLMSLIIIAYAFDALLKQAPTLAKELAGPTHVPMLGQGFGGLGYGHGMKGVMRQYEDKKTDAIGKAKEMAGNIGQLAGRR